MLNKICPKTNHLGWFLLLSYNYHYEMICDMFVEFCGKFNGVASFISLFYHARASTLSSGRLLAGHLSRLKHLVTASFFSIFIQIA